MCSCKSGFYSPLNLRFEDNVEWQMKIRDSYFEELVMAHAQKLDLLLVKCNISYDVSLILCLGALNLEERQVKPQS